jgi:Homeodomain-like domain
LRFRRRHNVKQRGSAMDKYKYRVTLDPEERAELERLVSVGKAAARKLTHARILLLADTAAGGDHPDDDIVAALDVGLRTIGRVRKRLVTEGLHAAIDHRPQPPRPDKVKIKGDVEQQLIRLACSEPPAGRCHWTLQLLADELVVLGLTDALSTETVRQALKKTTSGPGSSKPGACRRRPTPSSSGAWKT